MRYLITLTMLFVVLKTHAEFLVSNVKLVYTGMQIVVTYDLLDKNKEIEYDMCGRII